MDGPLVSIIVPTRDVAPYIAECIESLFNQTYRNIEVLAVDDSSTDGTLDILMRYATADGRLKVFETNQHGPSAGRNLALDRAKGEYIVAVDSDDILAPQALSLMVGAMEGRDIVAVDFKRTLPLPSPPPVLDVEDMDGRTAIVRILYQRTHGLNNSVWGKMFRRHLWKGIRFEEGRLYEDLGVFWRVFSKAKTVGYAAVPLYFYRCREGSLLNVFSPERLDVLHFTQEMVNEFSDKDAELAMAARDRHFSAAANMLILLHENDRALPGAEKKCLETINELCKEVAFNPLSRLKNRIGAFIALINPKILVYLSKIKK